MTFYCFQTNFEGHARKYGLQQSGDKILNKSREEPLECAARWFARSRDNDFTAQQQEEMTAWLDEDPANAQAFSEIQKTWDAVECVRPLYANQDNTSPAFCADKGKTKHSSGKTRLFPWFSGGKRPAFSLAFVLLLLCCMPFIREVFFESPHKPVAYYTGNGEQRTLALEDGTILKMNVKTALSVEMSKKLRQVLLHQGEVFFQVTPDAGRPFEIKTSNGLVRVLGTSFNIKERGGQVAVDVKQGKVRVSDSPKGPGDMRIKSVTLTADQGVDIGPDGRLVPVRPSHIQQVLAWQQGKVVFQNAPVSKVLEELELYHGVKIELQDHELGNNGISGVFDMQNLDQTLNLICMAASLRLDTTQADTKNHTLIVLKR